MAKRLKWTIFAKDQRKKILEFWIKKNKSKTYSKKLNKLFDEIGLLILRHPEIGINLMETDCRGRLIRDYYIVYRVSDTTIEIISVRDTRQNPEKLANILGL